MAKVRTKPEDWDEWIRPYLVRKTSLRRKLHYYSPDRVPFGLMVSHAVGKYLKWPVEGRCSKCGKAFVSSWNNIWLKKAYRGQEICGRCGRKEQYTDEWRHNNSEAQKKVQGTPDARRRMSKILKDSRDSDPSIRKRISQSLLRTYDGNDGLRKRIGDASRRNWRRAEYQAKVTGHGYHHGWFLSRCGRVYFASSWELMFLLWCDGCLDVLEFGRCQDAIEYEKPGGGKAYYHPDFRLVTGSGVSIVEVKGGRSDFDLVERKRQAALSVYNGQATYIILFKSDLQRMGVFRQSKTIGKWIGGLVSLGKVEEYGFGKKHS